MGLERKINVSYENYLILANSWAILINESLIWIILLSKKKKNLLFYYLEASSHPLKKKKTTKKNSE